MTEVKTTEALVSQGDSLYADGDYIESIRLYTEQLNQNDVTEAIAFRAHSHRSGAHFHCQNFKRALQDAKQASKIMKQLQNQENITLRPTQIEASYGRLGRAAMQLQQYEEAIEAFTKALQIRDDHQQSFNFINGGDHDYDRRIQVCKSRLSSTGTTKSNSQKSCKTSDALTTGTDSTSSEVITRKSTTETRPTMPKYQYYQNDSFMTIAILEPNVQAENLHVKFSKYKLSVILQKSGVDFTVCHGHLFDTVNVDKCKINIGDEKVLIKLKKVEAHSWHELFGAPKDEEEEEEEEEEEKGRQTKTIQSKPSGTTQEKVPIVKDVKQDNNKNSQTKPYASHRDWNAIERELKKQEANEKPEGEEALNKLFKNIYAGANSDTRRAMVKSFQTSGGTVLSTNWGEVDKKDYENERQAPKGMEWKDSEGRRLPQKDDD